ncbi:MAG TPA: aldehyde dehydrogenase family protein, partial [Trueperaceae bacterium]|nr:aldehyde dehydrogenase family protein [Trueperaceae bacterium]
MTRRNYVAGEWQAAAATRVNENPSDLDSPVGVYAQGSAADVSAAVEAARAALPAWASASASVRASVLQAAADELSARREELGELLSREEGKTRAEGIGEVARAADIFRFYASEAYRAVGELLPSARQGVSIEVRRQPVGVVGVITPWNFPIAIPAWKIAPALAYGNAVVFKPAELVPGSAWELAAILDRAGVPAGVFNLIMGRGSEVGEAIITHPDVNAVSFTGSLGVGRRVAAAGAARLARVQLELGGKNPVVVLDDADLDLAAEHVVNGAFVSTGQRCTASSRII